MYIRIYRDFSGEPGGEFITFAHNLGTTAAVPTYLFSMKLLDRHQPMTPPSPPYSRERL
jgi:hypothetical protein